MSLYFDLCFSHDDPVCVSLCRCILLCVSVMTTQCVCLASQDEGNNIKWSHCTDVADYYNPNLTHSSGLH